MNWEYSVFGLYAPGTLKSRAAQHKITTYDRRGRFVGVDPAGLESVVVIAGVAILLGLGMGLGLAKLIIYLSNKK